MATAPLSAANIEALMLKFPSVLNDAEKTLPDDQRMLIFRNRINQMALQTRQQQQNQNQNQNQNQVNRQQQQQQQQQAVQQNGVGNAGQGQMVQQPMSMSQGQQGMVVGGQGIQQGQPQQQGSMIGQNQAAFQQQLGQQQSQFPNLHDGNQRMQQQAAVQHQLSLQQQQQQHPSMPPIATPSPQQQGHPSPIPGQPMIGRSPNTARTPVNATGQSVPPQQTDTFMKNLPKMLELRRADRLDAAQAKAIDMIMATPEGKTYIRNYQARQANAIAAQQLNAHPAPQMSHAQVNLASQQQIAQLQQQQQQQQQAAAIAQAQVQAQAQIQAAHNAHYQQQQQQGINTNSQMQAVHLRQQQMAQAQIQAQAQQGGIRPPIPNQQLVNSQQLLARAQAQSQLLQAQNQQNHPNPQQIHLQEQMASQSPQMNFQSPRQVNQAPPNNNGAPVPNRMTAERMADVRQKLANMNDEQREAAFQKNPGLRSFYFVNSSQQGQQQLPPNMNPAMQSTSNVQMQSNPSFQGRQPPNMQNGFPAGTNNVPNLHIPPNKQRNSQTGVSGVPAGASPQVRPPLTLPAGMSSQQASAIQRMMQQGIPVSQVPIANQLQPPGQNQQLQNGQQQAGGARPNLQQQVQQQQQMLQGTQQPQQQQMGYFASANGVNPNQHITPAMLMMQMQGQPNQPHPGQLNVNNSNIQSRRLSDNGTVPLQLDRTGSLLARTTWTPTPEHDQSLQTILTSFQPPIKSINRPTLTQGLGMNRVLGDVLAEKMPDELRLLAEDTGYDVKVEGDAAGDAKRVSRKTGTDLGSLMSDAIGGGSGFGFPGQKKRKVQDLAWGIDKSLTIGPEVEHFMLELCDEDIDAWSDMTCRLAKHRNSDTIDRKDSQLAYETIFGRSIPGFSSDAIRLDQARALRRTQINPGRAAKLKLVAEAKVAYRKEKAELLEVKNAESTKLVVENLGIVASAC